MNNVIMRQKRRFLGVQLMTIFRLPLAGAYAAALWFHDRELFLVAAVAILFLAEISDYLDGSLARRWNVVSWIGGVIDPFVDSVFRLTVYFALASCGGVTFLVPIIMAFRDVTVAYSRIVCAHEGIAVAARVSGKIKAIVQAMGAVALTLCLPKHCLGDGFELFASILIAMVTVLSSFEYVAAAFKACVKDESRLS